MEESKDGHDFRAGSFVEAPPEPERYRHRLTSNLFENFFVVGASEQEIFNLIDEKSELSQVTPRVLASFKGTTTDAGLARLYFPLGYQVQTQSKRPTFFTTIKTDAMGDRTYHHVLVVYERVELDLGRAPSLVSMPSWHRDRVPSSHHLSPGQAHRARAQSFDISDNFEFTSSEDQDENEDEYDPLLQDGETIPENPEDEDSPIITVTPSPPLSRGQSKREDQIPEPMQGTLTLFAPIALGVESTSRNFEAFRALLTDFLYAELVAYEKHRALRFFAAYEKLVLLNTLNLPPANTAYRISFRESCERLEFDQQSEDFPWCSGVPLRVLFRQLSIRQVLLLFRAALLNRSVVLVSSRLNLLFYVSEALEQLMLPLKLGAPAVYIPITMDAAMISAPFPFVIGLHASLLPDAPDNPDALFVDIDKGFISLGSPHPDKREQEAERAVPCFPEIDRIKLELRLSQLLRPDNEDVDFAFPIETDAPPPEPHMSDAYFAQEVRRLMLGFMLKWLSHFQLNKDDFRQGGLAPNYGELKTRMVRKFRDAPQAQEFAKQLVQTTGFQLWCQEYTQRRQFESRYLIRPHATREISSPFTSFKHKGSQLPKMSISIRMPKDPYKLLQLFDKVFGTHEESQQTPGGQLDSFAEGSIMASLMSTSQAMPPDASFLRKRTDLGPTGDCRPLSKCIIKKVRELLDKQQQPARAVPNLNRDVSNLSDSTGFTPKLTHLHSSGAQRRLSTFSMATVARSQSAGDSILERIESQPARGCLITANSHTHPLSPKKGREGEAPTVAIQDLPHKSKKVHRRMAADGQQGAHPFNNVVRLFFGRKGFINFLNIIRRSLRAKNYNSLSFMECLMAELNKIRAKFFMRSQRPDPLTEPFESTSTMMDTDSQADSSISYSSGSLQQYDTTRGHSRGFSLDIHGTIIEEDPLRADVEQDLLRQRTARASARQAGQGECSSTKSQRTEASANTLAEDSMLEFEEASHKLYKTFPQFHYFCATHYERFGKKVLEILDCYIEAGKISDEGLPGSAVEQYINGEVKETVQRLHCNFFKQVIRTRPLVSRIISKVKQNKSKALIRGKISHLKESGRTPSQRPSVVEFKSDKRIKNITNWNYMPNPTHHRCEQCKDAAERPIQESLSVSIHALSEIIAWMKDAEAGKFKHRSSDNLYGGRAATELKKITEKYGKQYERLEAFPTESEALSMFLLNTVNYVILARTLEHCGKDQRPKGAYIWYKFLQECEIQVGELKLNALELLHCCLRAHPSYQAPFVNQCFKWPKKFSGAWESSKALLTVDGHHEPDISMGFHLPLRNMPPLHVFTRKSPLSRQLAQIKNAYLQAHLEVFYMELNAKVTVKLPQFFEWFILDYAGAQDVVERNTTLLVHIASATAQFEELKFSLLRSYVGQQQQISLRFTDFHWELPQLISSTS